jgi:hypothetical protein
MRLLKRALQFFVKLAMKTECLLGHSPKQVVKYARDEMQVSGIASTDMWWMRVHHLIPSNSPLFDHGY